MTMFADRVDAGERLATRLAHLRDEDPVVLGLPRGGVPVAFAVAEALDAPLDVIVVRKLGVPYQPELGMGAVGEDGIQVINHDVVRMADVSSEELAAVERRERAVVEERAHRFRGGRPRIPLTGRTAIIVDDGIATGSTMRAACQVARAHGAKRVVVAVPVAPSTAPTMFRDDADEMICLETPHPFYAVGQWYSDFTPTTDAEVSVLLSRAPEPAMNNASDDPPGDQPAGPSIRHEEVTVPAEAARLAGHITLPDHARGLVLFAHGSGSGRHSPRNRYVADVLNQAGLGTLLFDLLTSAEEIDRANVFDIELLAGRLVEVTRWLAAELGHEHLPIGYFGASTGGAAALVAATDADADVAAVVSRGGRPDLAGDALPLVQAPTLLIVGSRDEAVLALNRAAQQRLRCTNRLEVVRGATHLFEEPGTLQAAAELARDWFLTHLTAAQRR
jgi:putative phosphoribosyl transferase